MPEPRLTSGGADGEAGDAGAADAALAMDAARHDGADADPPVDLAGPDLRDGAWDVAAAADAVVPAERDASWGATDGADSGV